MAYFYSYMLALVVTVTGIAVLIVPATFTPAEAAWLAFTCLVLGVVCVIMPSLK